MDDVDIDFFMNVLFNRHDDCVGLNKPKPLKSNIEILVEHHKCLNCPNIFIPIPPITPIQQLSTNIVSFKRQVLQVLKACCIETYQSSLYIGLNPAEWNEFMPKPHENLDILWIEENNNAYHLLPNAKIYVFRSIFLEQYVSQFEDVRLVSLGDHFYIVCSKRIITPGIKICMYNLCIRFRWKQHKQYSQFLTLLKWGLENNEPNPKWNKEDVENFIEYKEYANNFLEEPKIHYVPISPKYQRRLVSPKYQRQSQKSIAELWLDKNIQQMLQ